MTKHLRTLFVGVWFGIILVKSEVVSWFRIQSMFKFEEFHMYGVIGTAVIVGALSLFLIRRFNTHTVDGDTINLQPKEFNKGTVIGGVIFGLGWAITGACPGPIYAQIGSGTAYMALITFVSALFGVYLYSLVRPHLPR